VSIVFPLQPRSKEPLRGLRWADADADSVQRAWETAPEDANRAVRLDDLTVIDCDSPEAVELWERVGPPTPLQVSTGRGRHFYYQRNLALRSGPLVPGIDIKTGPRAYVVAAGSTHPNGAHYELLGDGPPAELPDEAVTALRPTAVPALTGEPNADEWDTVPEGMRNVVLASLGGVLRKQGADEQVINRMLAGFNRAFCEPPLEDAEVASIARSITRYEPEPEREIVILDDLGHGIVIPTVMTAPELMALVLPPVQWVLPGVLPEGLAILGGKPKVGKSWMSLGLAVAVASGDEYLGATCEPGDVLYLALEDNARRLQKRLGIVLNGRPVPDRLTIATDWQRAPQGLLPIIQWCQTVERPRLIIVDTLAKFRPVTKGDTAIYQQDYASLTGLKKIADHFSLCAKVVHHQRKLGADDPLDTLSGTTGLSGAADTILLLEREGYLRGRGRDLERDLNLRVTLDADTGTWQSHGEGLQFMPADILRQWCYENLLVGSPMPSRDELMAATGISQHDLRDALKMAADQGWYEVGRGGRGNHGRYLGEPA